MEYLGEHLLPGYIGHLGSITSLVASLLATIAYFQANKAALNSTERNSWLRFARISFLIETICILLLFSSLFWIIYNHYFEYKYAWQHSDKGLQLQYLLSCFWEGQEGSFMLWSFWHCVLGWIIIWKNKTWEAGTMILISFAQFCLATMLIGIYFWNYKIGTSPFVLLRNEGILDNAPIFQDAATGLIRADYLNLLKDGQGLNVTLQNYWMVIHPPVLFLGFASTIVPFAFAFAGLLNKNNGWTKPAIPWASFSAAVLGTGIMMGAAWAYESLNFGGYWAWDPVENASLVPWLTLVAGLHTNLIYKSSGYSLRATYFFYIVTFLLILYSTFLTRSGILGDTSVHAFTDLGMNTQLYLFLFGFIWLIPIAVAKSKQQQWAAIALFVLTNVLCYFYPFFAFVSLVAAMVFITIILNQPHIPVIHKEENTYTREFWMFIGSLVLFLSAVVIIAKTSVPVFNKLFGTKIAPPENVELAYNQIQIFVAIIIGLLTAVTQFLKYKTTDSKQFLQKLVLPTVSSAIISVAISVGGSINYDKYGIVYLAAIHLAIFAAVYAIVGNVSFIYAVLKGKFKVAGASVAHIGFGMILLGILLSSSKKEVLSWNTTGIAVFKKNKTEDPAENITLFKGVKTDMGKYHVTYTKDTFNTEERKRFFEILFEAKEGKEKFTLYPDVIKNNKGAEGISANPANKHYLHKDIFVYISSYQEHDDADTTSFKKRDIAIGDTVFYSNGFLILNKVDVKRTDSLGRLLNGETGLFMDVTVMSKEGLTYKANPGIALTGTENIRFLPDTVKAQSLVLNFNKVGDNNQLEIGFKESGAINDLVTLKVYQFPMINVLWLGILVMVIGFIMSVVQRTRKQQPILKKVV